MASRVATCSCGQLRATCAGEPVRLSMCHCLECQKRTGSPFGVQARFRRDQVTAEGRAMEFTRVGDSGSRVTFRFCPNCGSTVYWTGEGFPDVIAVGSAPSRTRVSPHRAYRSMSVDATRGSSCRMGWSTWIDAPRTGRPARRHRDSTNRHRGKLDGSRAWYVRVGKAS